ncbi:hypothetical protein [Blastococcus tunisiensis]|nr:hypothetical protein [Blastococcus sp. DSM 46838]
MTSGGVLAVVLVLLGLGYLSVATLVVTLRGGRGPGAPPASHAAVDPAGFPVLPAARGVIEPRRTARRPATARIAAAVRAARDGRTTLRTSSGAGRRPVPGGGRTSAGLPRP